MKEKRRGNWKERRRNNTGSALITTLASVTLLMILGVMILTISTGNLQRKQIEYKMKQNFYWDEQILEDIYNGIGKTASASLSGAYARILSQVSETDGTAVYQTEQEAFEAFSRDFIHRMRANYPDDSPASHGATLAKINGYSSNQTAGGLESYEKVDVYPDTPGAVPEKLVFKKLVVTYEELDAFGAETGFASALTTDIVVEVPKIKFFEDSSRLFEYALIGNRGVYFQEGSRQVEGNVYAGSCDSGMDPNSGANQALFRNEDVYGGLNIYQANVTFSGNYLVSAGDINIRKSSVEIQGVEDSAGAAQIWTESIRTVEGRNKNTPEEPSSLNVDGILYVANDLELNARKSQVNLKGGYYGYNNGRYETKEKKNLESQYITSPGHTQSSAIIVNGNQSQLDLSNLDTFVVAGVAYVDLSSQAYPDGNQGKTEEYGTGESLALKTNQAMYLAPAQCLRVSNPVPTDEALPAAEAWSPNINWFGYSYIDAAAPLETKVYSVGGESYTYYYLHFAGAAKKDQYTSIVLNMVEPDEMDTKLPPGLKPNYAAFNEVQLEEIWKLKKQIASKAAAVSAKESILPGERYPIIAADDTKASIYTRGAVCEIAPNGNDVLSAPLPAADSLLSLDYIGKIESNLLKHYKYICQKLDPMEQFSLTSDALPDINPMGESQPVSEFVDMPGLIGNGAGQTYDCNQYYKTLLSTGDLTIDGSFQGIIFCKGDVMISGNVEGLIIADGSIYVRGDGSITASRSIVQAILDEEREKEAKSLLPGRNPSYATTWLKEYNAAAPQKENPDRVKGTEYTEYMSYHNWKKGEVN